MVDSPGIVNVEDKFNLECTHTGSSDSDPASPAGFDVVGYVVKIGRYTEEESRAFERIKAVLGHKVTEHMIVIFTHSDSVEENNRDTLIKDAPEELKKVLRECAYRYVMFDNRSPKKKPQVEKFLKVAKDLIQAKRWSRNEVHLPQQPRDRIAMGARKKPRLESQNEYQ